MEIVEVTGEEIDSEERERLRLAGEVYSNLYDHKVHSLPPEKVLYLVANASVESQLAFMALANYGNFDLEVVPSDEFNAVTGSRFGIAPPTVLYGLVDPIHEGLVEICGLKEIQDFVESRRLGQSTLIRAHPELLDARDPKLLRRDMQRRRYLIERGAQVIASIAQRGR